MTTFKVLFVIFIAYTTIFTAESDDELYHSYGYVSYNTTSVYNYHEAIVTWYEARRICQQEGGHLLILNSQDEASTLAPIIRNHGLKATFSGFHDIFKLGEFITIFGQPLNESGYSIWTPSYPIVTNYSECGGIMFDGTLTNLPCDMLGPFFCEKDDNDSKKWSVGNVTESSYVFHPEAETWPEAASICQKTGGYLAIVNNEQEVRKLEGMFMEEKDNIVGAESEDYFNIGFHSLFINGEYLSVKGEPLFQLGYTEWHESEPNSDGNCGALISTKNATGLADIPCDHKYAYICEIN